MNPSGGAATQIFAQQFDRRYFNLPAAIQERIQRRIDEMGQNLRNYSHYKMQGMNAYRLRVGDYRIVYQFDIAQNELLLIAVGHRRDVYKLTAN